MLYTTEGEGVIVGEAATENNGNDVTVGIVWAQWWLHPLSLLDVSVNRTLTFELRAELLMIINALVPERITNTN